MIDLRPVGYVIGLLVTILGMFMLVPMVLDMAEATGHWPVFFETAILTIVPGGVLALSCASGVRQGLTIQQTFLITTGVWLALPIFGALPFLIGATELGFTDAFFEAMSGLTTTGSTVITGLSDLPSGLLLWRGILQWLGGIGIIVVAMVFLPELRVGGMQIFRSEGFDTFGKILPRATEIASRISVIYVGLTMACAMGYLAAGMSPFDATVHAMTTIATGGFANDDSSFGVFSPSAEYTSALFMLLAALPFVRFVQLTSGTARPLLTRRSAGSF
jgi:trk system potassium uptake protein TrkH